jgi:GntR family transcriptional regulator
MSSDQIIEDLTERIRAGEYPPGTQMPTYRELAQLYDVGFTTVANVYRRMRDRGLLVGVQGRGVYVPDELEGTDYIG